MNCIDNCRQGRWPCATPERCGLFITTNSDGTDEAADRRLESVLRLVVAGVALVGVAVFVLMNWPALARMVGA